MGTNGISKTILLCDDDRGIVDAMEIILTDFGYNVHVVTDGGEVYKKVIELKPDLILLDLWMPNMDGSATTQKLKSNDETKKIPVIIVSANNETERIAKESGADSFLSKPFEVTALEEKINQFLP